MIGGAGKRPSIIPRNSSSPLIEAAVSAGTRPYVLFGGLFCGSISLASCPLVLAHHLDEPREQIMAVAWAGRRFGMVLHREHRLVPERDAAVRAVEQRDMRLGRVRRQGRAVDREAVVHRGDLDLAGAE